MRVKLVSKNYSPTSFATPLEVGKIYTVSEIRESGSYLIDGYLASPKDCIIIPPSLPKETIDNDYRFKKKAIHCKTEQEAIELIDLLNELGYGFKASSNATHFDIYKENTCYTLYTESLSYSDTSYFKDSGFEIVEYENLRGEKIMRKQDLKAGYTLVDERGRNWHLFDSKNGLSGYMFKDDKVVGLHRLAVDDALNDDLTLSKHALNPSCDIVEVRGPHRYTSNIFKDDIYDTPLLWKRKPKFKLSETEKSILEMLIRNDYIYIARDSDGELYAFQHLPEKDKSMWLDWLDVNEVMILILSKDYLPFIKWEDEEPYTITDILNNIA